MKIQKNGKVLNGKEKIVLIFLAVLLVLVIFGLSLLNFLWVELPKVIRRPDGEGFIHQKIDDEEILCYLKVTVRPINLLKWAVFGTLTLVKRTNGTYGFYDDAYNFEMNNALRPDELLRNANTKIGSPTCGSLSGCIGFNISFNKTNYNPKNIINLSD